MDPRAIVAIFVISLVGGGGGGGHIYKAGRGWHRDARVQVRVDSYPQPVVEFHTVKANMQNIETWM